jgi:hypothetical protein
LPGATAGGRVEATVSVCSSDIAQI